MTDSIVVSIINYRTAELTVQCVQSVLDDIGDLAVHVVVVDNASGDGSDDHIAGWIAAQDPPVPVTLVRSAVNGGFSAGHNLGFAARAGEYYLVLNSDAVLTPGFLQTLLTSAKAHPEAGLIAPRLMDPDGTPQISCFRFASPASEFIRSARTGIVTRVLQRFDVSLGTEPDPARIEWASFACILLRAEMIAAIGPMDEGYFLYFEDAEYCLRARRAGWRIHFVPRARAIHFRGGSGPVKSLAKAGKRMPDYYYASRARFLRQAHGRFGPLRANLCWMGGRLLAQLRRLAGKPVNPMNEAEARDIWIGTFARAREAGSS